MYHAPNQERGQGQGPSAYPGRGSREGPRPAVRRIAGDRRPGQVQGTVSGGVRNGQGKDQVVYIGGRYCNEAHVLRTRIKTIGSLEATVMHCGKATGFSTRVSVSRLRADEDSARSTALKQLSEHIDIMQAELAEAKRNIEQGAILSDAEGQ